MLKIIQAPNPVLSQRARPISKIDKSINRLIKDMTATLINAHDPEGVGLAAPQVDKPLQLFLIRQTPRSPILVFINPFIEEYIDELSSEIASASVPTEPGQRRDEGVKLEGCLSLYSIWGDVKRYPGVILSYQDETGKNHKRKFTGFIATIIQHEFDHLQGVLFPKRVIEQQRQLYKSKLNEKGQTEFEEIEL